MCFINIKKKVPGLKKNKKKVPGLAIKTRKRKRYQVLQSSIYSVNQQAAIDSTAVADAYNSAVRFWPISKDQFLSFR
jgi:hypothetical protein